MAINIFTASGRLGNDMNVSYTPNGKCIGDFPLPVESGYGDNKKTAWVTCKVLGERAEKLAQYLTKGSQVTVTGSFQLDEWEKNGVKHSRPVVIVSDLQLPPMQQSSGNQHPQQQGGWGQSQQPQQRQPQRQQVQPQYNEPPQDYDDSIPFAPIALQYRSLLNAI